MPVIDPREALDAIGTLPDTEIDIGDAALQFARIDAPAADITGAQWIIGSVTYRKDMSGTHADLILMPPDAFQPDPNPLNLFDAEVMRSPQVSQSPAPATTGNSQ